MYRYIAFLRGINVGGHVVKMERLRALFVELGVESVETFIASGNVIFASSEANTETLERQIEQHLRMTLGYDVATFIRTGAEVVAITSANAFVDAPAAPQDATEYVAFLHTPPSPTAWENLLAVAGPTDDFRLIDREIYWRCHTRLSDSPMFTGGLFEKMVKAPLTMRNMTTLRRLAAKHGAPTTS